MCGCEHANNIGICEECYKKTLVDNDLEEFGPLFKDFRLFSQKYQNRVLKLAFLQSNTFWAENGKRIDSEFEKMKNQYKSLYELTIPNDAL